MESNYRDEWEFLGFSAVFWTILVIIIGVTGLVFALMERPLNDIHRDAVKHSAAYIETHQDQALRLEGVARSHEAKIQAAVTSGDDVTADQERTLYQVALADLERELSKLARDEQPQTARDYLNKRRK